MKKYKSKFIKEEVLSVPTEIVLDENITDEAILRMCISAEQSAINLYNTLAKHTTNPKLKTILKDIAREEKVHIGEFWSTLQDVDWEELQAFIDGQVEVNGKV